MLRAEISFFIVGIVQMKGRAVACLNVAYLNSKWAVYSPLQVNRARFRLTSSEDSIQAPDFYSKLLKTLDRKTSTLALLDKPYLQLIECQLPLYLV
jgi:hypothetical protein